MANFESHTLFCAGLKSKLIEAGVLEELPEDCSAPGTHRIYFERCNKDAWAEQLQKVLEYGVINFALKKPDGSGYGVRRDYTEKEKADLGWYPVVFGREGDEMLWQSSWVALDDPAYYASCALPDQTLIFAKYFEGADDGGCYLQGGEVVADKPIIQEGTAGEMLTEAITALKAANLDCFAEEMVKRLSSVTVTEEAIPLEDQQISVLMDYVHINWDYQEDYDPWYIPPEAYEATEESGTDCEWTDEDLPF